MWLEVVVLGDICGPMCSATWCEDGMYGIESRTTDGVLYVRLGGYLSGLHIDLCGFDVLVVTACPPSYGVLDSLWVRGR